jgi:hypothetical protein
MSGHIPHSIAKITHFLHEALVIEQQEHSLSISREGGILCYDPTVLYPFTVSLFALSLLLSACGGVGSNCAEEVWTGKFGICIGEGWEQVSEEELRAEGVPEETIAAFQLSETREGQRDNIVVSRERVQADDAVEYSQANIRIIEKTPEYALIEKREVKVGGQKTILHIFTARPVPDLPARRFYQVSLVDGNRGYVFTGTLPFTVDEEIEEGIIEMMLSARLNE